MDGQPAVSGFLKKRLAKFSQAASSIEYNHLIVR
jgi:hypothetical protein